MHRAVVRGIAARQRRARGPVSDAAARGLAINSRLDMGNGLTDTTMIGSDFYLMVYYPDPPIK